MHVDVKPSSPLDDAATTARRDETRAVDLDEAEVLRQEAQCAKAAISRKLSDLKSAAAHAADPKELARAHPWLTVGAAAVAGFAAASLVMPRKGERATDRIEQLLEKLQAASSHVQAANPAPMAAPASPILGTLFELAKTAATTFFLNAAQQNGAAQQAAASQEPQSNSTTDPATPSSAAATDAAFL